MKKTMFITSVIMVVVMAIALTTSSLAWFTSNSAPSVSTNAFQITAKSNTSTGLYISNDSTAFSVNPITLADDNASSNNSEYKPMVPYLGAATPNADADKNDAVGTALVAGQMIGNTVRTYYDSTATENKAYWSGTAYTTNYFSCDDIYVANAGETPVAITASITFSNVTANGAPLYVAVLAKTASSWELVAIKKSDVGSTATEPYAASADNMWVGNTAANFAGTTAQNEAAGSYNLVNSAIFQAASPTCSVCTYNTTSTIANTTSENLTGKTGDNAWGGVKQFKVIAWYADELNNGNSGTNSQSSFVVTFTAAAHYNGETSGS